MGFGRVPEKGLGEYWERVESGRGKSRNPGKYWKGGIRASTGKVKSG